MKIKSLILAIGLAGAGSVLAQVPAAPSANPTFVATSGGQDSGTDTFSKITANSISNISSANDTLSWMFEKTAYVNTYSTTNWFGTQYFVTNSTSNSGGQSISQSTFNALSQFDGQYVYSYLLVYKPTSNGNGEKVSGSVTFYDTSGQSYNGYGVVLSGGDRQNTNSVFGKSGFSYGGSSYSMDSGDSASFASSTSNVLNLTLSRNSSSDSDVLRVITAVPEPESYAMLMAGIGIIGVVARRRKYKA